MKCPHCTVEFHPNWNTGNIKAVSSRERESEDDEYFRSGLSSRLLGFGQPQNVQLARTQP